MSSPLERIKDLKPEPPDAKEFAGLKSSAAGSVACSGEMP